MTQRDLVWRVAGAALIASGALATRAATAAAGSADLVGLLGVLVAAGGLLLLICGKKVGLALRVERSRHRELPGAIRTARQARRRNR
ncbi:hypothetical protein [Sphingopyxis sp.]|uniref:hypothetical protein n=1 Tax=Sphingopyxis sp. TaxID=1908224 RepID=UPI003D0B2A96